MLKNQLEDLGVSDVIYDRTTDYTFFLDDQGAECTVPMELRATVQQDLRQHADEHHFHRVFCTTGRHICMA